MVPDKEGPLTFIPCSSIAMHGRGMQLVPLRRPMNSLPVDDRTWMDERGEKGPTLLATFLLVKEGSLLPDLLLCNLADYQRQEGPLVHRLYPVNEFKSIYVVLQRQQERDIPFALLTA